MTNGERLHLIFIAHGVFHVWQTDWRLVPPADKVTLEMVANDMLQVAQTFLVPVRTWKAELYKFGRHLPDCPIGAPCTCGFADIERELAA
jgi:hypothetical protein